MSRNHPCLQLAHIRLGFAAALAGLLLSACAGVTSVPSLAPRGLDPTQFLQTRVPQVLTENAGTLTAQPTATPTRTPSPTRTATETPSLTPTLTMEPSLTPMPTLTPTPSPTPTITPTPRPTIALSNFPLPPTAFGGDSHFLMARPVGEGGNVFIYSAYRYGDTNLAFETHHGVEFANPQGTPLVAVAPGIIAYAGDDQTQVFGAHPNFYGNLVIVQLAQPWRGHTVYALYGHMSTVEVKTGQSVTTGELLGTVGQTGVALGPHLHFEVRLDNPEDYGSTENPELWLVPAGGGGTLAVRVVNDKKRYLPGVRVDMVCSDGAKRYLVTYWDPGVRPDLVYGENAGMTDIPAGMCHLSAVIYGNVVEADARITEGGITFVRLVGSQTP